MIHRPLDQNKLQCLLNKITDTDSEQKKKKNLWRLSPEIAFQTAISNASQAH